MDDKKEFKLIFPRKKLIIIGRKGMKLQAINIEKNESIPIWLSVKIYLNSLKMNQQFTRKQLLSHVYKEATVMCIEYSSIDFYRSLLSRLEYIETIKPGVYVKRDDIPENVSLSLIRKFSSNKQSWKEWFIPTEERRKQIRKICENG